MKKVFLTWGWSLAVVARSPAALLGLAVLAGLWGFAGYEWLSLPESSVLILIIAAVWALGMWIAAAAIIAGTAAGAAEAAAMDGRSLRRFAFITFRPRLVVRTLLFSPVAAGVVFAVSSLFDWVNAHTVEVGSFLTFHTETPTSHIWLERVFTYVEWLLWVAVAGWLLRNCLSLIRIGWRELGRDFRRAFADCFLRGSLLSGLLAVTVFGWVPWQLANWQPKVQPGFWDYIQLLSRMGAALLLMAYGWLFWLLTLMRLKLTSAPPFADPAAAPAPPHS